MNGSPCAQYACIAAYRFARLEDLRARKSQLLRLCNASGLKGTILLSPEGINLFVAGRSALLEALMLELRSWPGLADLQVRATTTDHQPFRRMLVRIKKEIIAFGVEGIDPARRTSAKLAPADLKRWLDEGRPVTLLDTRNDYEVKLGTFKSALALGISQFRQFPAAMRDLPEDLKQRTLVMFCTGGIRCEKAGPLLEREGFQEVFQLDGGILGYFAECGGAHYEGECFVFDQRVGVDAALKQSRSVQCLACQRPLTEADQLDPRYVPDTSCPACFRTPAERSRDAIERREALIRSASQPLPGSRPQDSFKPINVPSQCDGQTVLQALCAVVRHLGAEYWQGECVRDRVLDADRRPVAASHPVRAGERYLHLFTDVVEPDVNADIRILHEDEALVALNKPAPLPMHAGGRFYRNTLQYFLDLAYRPQKPRPAHRLDANTSGIVLVTRTRRHAARLQPQFASGAVDKRYLARVGAHPRHDLFDCDAPIGTDAGRLGSRRIDLESGAPARTEFRVIDRSEDGTALIEARPLTGRTNQIRVHLWHLGLPVCGDPAYLAQGLLGETQTVSVADPPLCLHAWQIGFRHPESGAAMRLRAPAPAWARFDERLGQAAADPTSPLGVCADPAPGS